MKPLLTRLTLGLVAVIVAVLAGYLILIAVALLHANRNLDKLVGDLEAVRDNTRSLDSDISTVNEAAMTIVDRLSEVDAHMRSVDRSLQR